MKYWIQMRWYDYLDFYDRHRFLSWVLGILLFFGIVSGTYYGIDKYVNGESRFVEETPIDEEVADDVVEDDSDIEFFDLEEPEVAKIEEIETVEETTEIVRGEGSVSFLLLGIDAYGEKMVGRSDTMIVVTANKKDGSMKMVSIPRDSYVSIIGKGFYDKITHAYAFGGSDMAEATVENLLGIEIDHVVAANFNSFARVVDIVGGVTVDVPFDFDEKMVSGGRAYFTKGEQTLNGDEALAYARMRKRDPRGDLGRNERQQQIIEALIREVASFGSVTKIKDLYDVAKDNVETDVGALDVIGLIPYATGLGDVERLNIEGSGVMINKIYYHQLNTSSLNSVRDALKSHLIK